MAIASQHLPHTQSALRLTFDGGREIDALSDADRTDLAACWQARATNELYASAALRRVSGALNELSAGAALTSFALSAHEDELRHVELCRAVAGRFAGHELPWPSETPVELPEFSGATARLTAALHVIAHTVIAETFSSSVLESSLRLASGRVARSALVQMLSDELDHAPIGWTYLAGTTDAERRAIEPFLHALVAAELKRARAALGHTRGLASHGVPTHAAVERALFGCVRESILPGFLSFGMPAHEIWTWLRKGASTRPEALRDVANFPDGGCFTGGEESFDLR